MERLFTTATVLLSPEFVDKVSHREVLTKLRKLRLVTGVQFTCRAKKTYALHGTWEQINATFDLLNHWQSSPDHEPSSVDSQNNENCIINKLCDCPFVEEILSIFGSVKRQSETESRNVIDKTDRLCINTEQVREDIDNLTVELERKKHKLQLNAEKNVLNENIPQNADFIPANHKLNFNIMQKTNTQNIVRKNEQSLEGRSSKLISNNSASPLNTCEEQKIKVQDAEIKSPEHAKDTFISSKRLTRGRKSCIKEVLNTHNGNKNLDRGSSSKEERCAEQSTRKSPNEKSSKKPGDKGYWSRVKRNDKHSEHQCTLCGVVLKSRKRFFEHKRRIHLKEYQCLVCLKGFGYPTDLKRHKCLGPADQRGQQKHKQTLPKKKEIVKKAIEKVQCPECNFTTSSNAKLFVHKKRLHSATFDCDICQKKLGFLKDLYHHMKTSHNEAYFVCEKCSKMYKSKARFDMHLKTHEPGYSKPNFMCSSCGKIFTTKHALTVHTRVEHLGQRQTYLCQICGKYFKQRNSYKQHTNAHHGIRPYQCDHCGKSFTYHKSLREHQFMHENVRRFECDVCDKKFRQRTTLRIHQKTHKLVKDHACSVCGKEFTQKQALERHERIHSGVRPYKCLVCEKDFGDASTIKRHMVAFHHVNELKWRDSIQCSLKKKSDYYVLGGAGQNRTYSYKTSKCNSSDSNTLSDVKLVTETVTDENVSSKSDVSRKKNYKFIMEEIPVVNRGDFAKLTADQNQSVDSSGSTNQTVQIQVPSTCIQTLPNNVPMPIQGSLIPADSNFISLPTRVPSQSISNTSTVQNHTVQFQGSSFQIQGQFGQILDLSAVSFLPAKPIDNQMVEPTSKGAGSEFFLQQLNSQTSQQNLPVTGTSGSLVQSATLVPVVPMSDYLRVSSQSSAGQTAPDSGVTQAGASIWGFVGYPSYYTTSGAMQYVPVTTQ